MDPKHLRIYVVRPALKKVNLWSPQAEELVLATAAQESQFTWLHQLGNGPGVGLWQMEPFTHDDIWKTYLRYKPELAELVQECAAPDSTWDAHVPVSADQMHWNLLYAAAMCRIRYRRAPDTLPPASDVLGMAKVWKKRYNTYLGKGTIEQFVDNYETLVLGKERSK